MNLAIFQLLFRNATHYATTLFTHFPTSYHFISLFKLQAHLLQQEDADGGENEEW